MSIQSFNHQLGQLFPARDCATLARLIRSDAEKVFPEEEAIICDAAEGRKAEFRSGRKCAHLALKKLNVKPCPIMANPSRSLIWPIGSLGCISHTKNLAAAAVSMSSVMMGIGLDIEHTNRLHSRVWRFVLTNREQEWVAQCCSTTQRDWATMIFSAKECFYKFQYPITQTWFGFLDVEVDIDRASCTFSVAITNSKRLVTPIPSILNCNFLFTSQYVLTGIYALI